MSASVPPPVSVEPGGDDGPAVLRIRGLARRFGGLTAVDGVEFALAPTERLAIIGPNGAGKTTLFRLIAGELRPTTGRIELFGRDVTDMPAHRRARLGLARTFQISNLFGTLTVAENVRLAAQAGHASRWRFWAPLRADDELATTVEELLGRVGLDHRGSARVADLSHGEQRQLEVAMALVTRPRLLLLDEPAAGLAAGERARLRRLLDDLPRELPVVLIEHDMTLALGIADRVLCLDNGKPVAMGTVAEVRDDARVQAVYLGRQVSRA